MTNRCFDIHGFIFHKSEVLFLLHKTFRIFTFTLTVTFHLNFTIVYAWSFIRRRHSWMSTEILFFVFRMPMEHLIVVYQISFVQCYLFFVTSASKFLSSSLSSNMLSTSVSVAVFSKRGRWLQRTQLVRTVLYEAPRSSILKLLFCCLCTYSTMRPFRAHEGAMSVKELPNPICMRMNYR